MQNIIDEKISDRKHAFIRHCGFDTLPVQFSNMKFFGLYLLATAAAQGKCTIKQLRSMDSDMNSQSGFGSSVSCYLENSTCTLVNAGCQDFQFIVEIVEECRQSDYSSINASRLYANGNQG